MPPPKPRREGGFYDRLEQGFLALESGYRSVLGWTLDHRLATIAITMASVGAAVFFASQLEGEFFPPADEENEGDFSAGSKVGGTGRVPPAEESRLSSDLLER